MNPVIPELTEIALSLITLGALLLAGLITNAIGRHTRLPRVTLLLLLGFCIGPSVLNILPPLGHQWFPVVADMALVMVGFLLGEKFILSHLKRYGRYVFGISIWVSLSTVILVTGGLYLLRIPFPVALLFGTIATATAPAATIDIVDECSSKGEFTDTLLGIVAVDDAWGLILFSLALAAVQASHNQGGTWSVLIQGGWEIGGAVLVGIVLGLPMAFFTGRVRPGEPTLVEALGVVFLCGGICLWLNVSYLLASMVLGAMVANLARHHKRPFHAIEDIEWPFMILFFILAGASLRLGAVTSIGILGVAYIILRFISRLIGARIGGFLTGASPLVRKWMGLALTPQAGVAMGMAIVAKEALPDSAQTILPVIIGSTVFFELVGPLFTRLALQRSSEIMTPASDEKS
jgi:Kef-type K+ transport system membrane component KefB